MLDPRMDSKKQTFPFSVGPGPDRHSGPGQFRSDEKKEKKGDCSLGSAGYPFSYQPELVTSLAVSRALHSLGFP